MGNVLNDAIIDIIDMFEEHKVSEICLKEPVRLRFHSRFTEELDTLEMDKIVLHNGLLYLCSKYKSYCTYELSDKADIVFLYDVIYQHFNNN